MSIDPTGTTPGLPASGEEKPEPVHMKCRRESCDSILAYEVKMAGENGGRKLYRCVKCHHPRSIVLGGAFNLLASVYWAVRWPRT